MSFGTSFVKLLANLFASFSKETPNGHKKKIIPVGSDFEGSPSPDFPSSPSETPKMPVMELEENKKNKKMNFKWKSSVSKFSVTTFTIYEVFPNLLLYLACPT